VKPLNTLLRTEALPTICACLPVRESSRLAALDPDDFLTHVETYLAVRRFHPVLPPGALDGLVEGLIAYLECPAIPVQRRAPLRSVKSIR
jgi:hypothetical protein